MTQQTKGFSLIELLSVLSILGILIAIGSLYSVNAIQKQKLTEASTILTENLRQAGNTARLESRFLTLSTDATGTIVTWNYASDNSQLKEIKLPSGTTVNANTTVTFSGRGLPIAPQTYTVTQKAESKNIYLLPTGAVIAR